MNKAICAPGADTFNVFPGIAGTGSVARRLRPRRLTAGAIAVAVVLLGSMLVASQSPAFGVPIDIMRMTDLRFGTLSADPALAGTVTINPMNNVKTVDGGVLDLGGVHSRATFRVTGDANTAFTVILPSSVTLTSGASSMTLNGISSDPSGVGILNGGGIRMLFVSGTLQVGAGQAAGTYSGAFTVIVNY